MRDAVTNVAAARGYNRDVSKAYTGVARIPVVEIEIRSTLQSAEELRGQLLAKLGETSGVKLAFRAPAAQFRVIEPAVLVAAVGAAGGALGVLVAGLLKIVQEARTGRIVVQARDGVRLEFPSDISRERLDELVAVVAKLDQPVIHL